MDSYLAESSLAVLYLLMQSPIPLNAEQITEAMELAGAYTYFDTVVSIDAMLNKEFIRLEKMPLGEFYSITINGRIELSRLAYAIPSSKRKTLSEYINKNAVKISLTSHITSYLIQDGENKNQLWLRAYDRDMDLNDIVITFADSETAKKARYNWDNHADDAIAALYGVLLKD